MRVIGEMLGPFLLYPWVRWLLQRARQDQLGELHFLARDGYLPQKIFDAWARHEGLKLSTRYLEVSRRPLNLSHLPWASPQLFDFLTSGIEGYGGPQLLRRLDLSPADLPQPSRWNPLWHFTPRYRPAWYRAALRRAFLALEPVIAPQLRKIRDHTSHYLRRSLILEDPKARIGIVDLGWRGTLQASLESLLETLLPPTANLQVHGYYFGLFPDACATRARTRINSVRHGYYLDPAAGGSNEQRMQRLLLPLMESLLGAPGGSAWSYDRQGNVTRLENRHECGQYEAAIQPLQEGMLRGCLPNAPLVRSVDQWMADTGSDGSDLVDATFELLHHSLPQPFFEDLRLLRHWDGFDHAGDGIRLDNHQAMPWRPAPPPPNLLRKVWRRLRRVFRRRLNQFLPR
jgi:hypothetical protein